MDLKPPAKAADEAQKALELRKEFGRGGTMVGVARARDLANRKELSPDTIKRMVSFFARHEVDKQGKGFYAGDEGYPSAGRIAWGLWGGDPGRAWANKMVRQIERNEGVTEMIDVNVLAGADIRRIDGKYGKIKKVSLPWVTVRWGNGVEESYLRSDESLSEDIEIKTLDAGWIPLGEVVGLNEKVAKAATDDEGMDEEDDEEEDDSEDEDEEEMEDEEEDEEDMEEGTRSFHDLVEDIRRIVAGPRPLNEATSKAKEKAKAALAKSKKAKAPAAPAAAPAPKKKAAKKKSKKAKKGITNPFVNYKSLGKYSPKKVQRRERKIWKCVKDGANQKCTARKDVEKQGIKKGTVKIVKPWAGKDAYRDDYDAGRESGKYKTPDGKVKPVAHIAY